MRGRTRPGGRPLRRGALRHGHAGPARGVRAYLGHTSPSPSGPDAIATVKADHPGFLFMAEVYWDLEWELQQQGFDYTYDKRLYDRLRGGRRPTAARPPARRHGLPGALGPVPREPRRAQGGRDLLSREAPGGRGRHLPLPGAAVLPPGAAGGSQSSACPCTSAGGPLEPVDEELRPSTGRCWPACAAPRLREGEWRLLDCRPAWDGNWTHDCFVASAWDDGHGHRALAVVNFADVRSQCFLPLPFDDLAGAQWRLEDVLGDAVYDRDGAALLAAGALPRPARLGVPRVQAGADPVFAGSVVCEPCAPVRRRSGAATAPDPRAPD